MKHHPVLKHYVFKFCKRFNTTAIIFSQNLKEAKKKSKGGSKAFEESLREVLENGNPLVNPSETLSKTAKELLAKSDK